MCAPLPPSILPKARNDRGGYQYNTLGRLTGITAPLGGTVGIFRDSEGKPITVTDATGVATGYSFDALGYSTALGSDSIDFAQH